MIEYLKRKLAKATIKKDLISFPHYYEENGRLIKELANGEKWLIKLDSEYKEILLEKIQ